MKPQHIIERALDFGTFRSRENFFAFTLKCIFYIIPAIILGNYTDRTIKKMQSEKKFSLLSYILLQTFIIISTLFIILLLLTNYTSEFQVTLAGGLFMVLYFGLQTNYIKMIKEYTQ
jgi:hypothetical protein